MALPKDVQDAVSRVDRSLREWRICQSPWQTIRAHLLSQDAQTCEHDWAVGYGVPAYCNHCGIERDPKPAQSVDIEAIREVIVWLRSGSMAITANAGIAADKLEAALQECEG